MSQQRKPSYRLKRIAPGVFVIAGLKYYARIVASPNGAQGKYMIDIIVSHPTEAVTEPRVFTATLSDAAVYARDTLQQLDREPNHG
jgi:hypothetical protein